MIFAASLPATRLLVTATGDSTHADLTGIALWAVQLMEAIGPVGAALVIALETFFPFLPSEVVLPLVGFSANRGAFSLAEGLIWTTVGSIVGAYGLYLVSRLFGLERVRWVADRMPLIDVADVDKSVTWFRKHDRAAVFFGRMLPVFRSLISIPAGVERMHTGWFFLLTAIGSAIWNAVFVLAGYLLGENWHLIEPYADVLQKIVIVAVLALVVWWVVARIRRNARRRRAVEALAAKPADEVEPGA